jgi:hypothetical protein
MRTLTRALLWLLVGVVGVAALQAAGMGSVNHIQLRPNPLAN